VLFLYTLWQFISIHSEYEARSRLLNHVAGRRRRDWVCGVVESADISASCCASLRFPQRVALPPIYFLFSSAGKTVKVLLFFPTFPYLLSLFFGPALSQQRLLRYARGPRKKVTRTQTALFLRAIVIHSCKHEFLRGVF
jgi:hypothetical protein